MFPTTRFLSTTKKERRQRLLSACELWQVLGAEWRTFARRRDTQVKLSTDRTVITALHLNILKQLDINNIWTAIFMYEYYDDLLELLFDEFFCLNAKVCSYYTNMVTQ